MIPDRVYSYINGSHETTVRRPPIMYLFSSAMFTSLSDADLLARKDKAIAEQVARARSDERDLNDAPSSSQIRNKDRHLGAEVWLEFSSLVLY